MHNDGRLRKLYLVSLSSTEGAVPKISPASMRITFKVLCRSVDDLLDIELFPMTSMERPAFLRGLEDLAVAAGPGSIFGISVMSNYYPLLRKVSSLLRERAPESPIIAGGRHSANPMPVILTSIWLNRCNVSLSLTESSMPGARSGPRADHRSKRRPAPTQSGGLLARHQCAQDLQSACTLLIFRLHVHLCLPHIIAYFGKIV